MRPLMTRAGVQRGGRLRLRDWVDQEEACSRVFPSGERLALRLMDWRSALGEKLRFLGLEVESLLTLGLAIISLPTAESLERVALGEWPDKLAVVVVVGSLFIVMDLGVLLGLRLARGKVESLS